MIAGSITKETYALLDEDSDISLCKADLAEQLKANATERSYTLTTVNKEFNTIKGSEVSLKVMSLDGTEAVDLVKVWTVERIPVSTRSLPSESDLQRWPHLHGLTLPAIEESKITILIGSDVPEVFWQLEERRGKQKEPSAAKSLLGWTVIGPSGNKKGNAGNVNFVKYEDEVLQKQFLEI